MRRYLDSRGLVLAWCAVFAVAATACEGIPSGDSNGDAPMAFESATDGLGWLKPDATADAPQTDNPSGGSGDSSFAGDTAGLDGGDQGADGLLADASAVDGLPTDVSAGPARPARLQWRDSVVPGGAARLTPVRRSCNLPDSLEDAMDRRTAIGAIGTITAATALAAAGKAMATEAKIADSQPFAPGQHAVVPLPFDPKKLDGISEKMIVSHHDNNYVGAVKNLNKVEEAIAAAKDAPPFTIAGLRERELTFANSKVLHELYFGNLGGDGKASGGIDKAIASTFGGFANWQAQFQAVGAALGGGSGWVALGWSFHLGQMRIAWSGGHTQALTATMPLLIMDMYEHAYQVDFGAGAAKYVEVFFRNVNWQEVDKRFERAQKAQVLLRG